MYLLTFQNEELTLTGIGTNMICLFLPQRFISLGVVKSSLCSFFVNLIGFYALSDKSVRLPIHSHKQIRLLYTPYTFRFISDCIHIIILKWSNDITFNITCHIGIQWMLISQLQVIMHFLKIILKLGIS